VNVLGSCRNYEWVELYLRCPTGPNGVQGNNFC